MRDEDLRRAAESTKEEPWLFFRKGLDWQWQSHREMAGKVLSGRESLETHLSKQESNFARARYRLGLDPAGVLAGLIVAATRDSWEGEAFGHAAEGQPLVIHFDENLQLELRRSEDAHSSRSGLESLLAGGSRSEIRHSIGSLNRAIGGLDETRRSCVCLSPRVDLAWRQAAVEWAFERSIALVAEPDTDLFVQTLVWARPAVAICEIGELASLKRALRGWVDGRMRRFLRLRRVVTVTTGVESSRDLESLVMDESRLMPSNWPADIEIHRWER